MDIHIAEKMSSFLLLGQWMDGHPLQFSREFMSTDDHYRFNEDAQGFIVYEGKMFEQFNSVFETPRWWITIDELKKTHFYDRGDWQHSGNLTSKLDNPSEIHNYCKNRWS